LVPADYTILLTVIQDDLLSFTTRLWYELMSLPQNYYANSNSYHQRMVRALETSINQCNKRTTTQTYRNQNALLGRTDSRIPDDFVYTTEHKGYDIRWCQ
jgi:hypothetical protein